MKHDPEKEDRRQKTTRGDVEVAKKKKRYRRPGLTAHGDVRDITFGGSLGAGESEDPNRFP